MKGPWSFCFRAFFCLFLKPIFVIKPFELEIKNALRRILNKREYFLVIGAGRGGTSLLASMIDSHPSIQVGFERFAVDFLLAKNIPGAKGKSAVSRLNMFDKACLNELLKGDRLWGNKITTEQIAALKECGGDTDGLFINNLVKSRKVVFVVRDGRYCVASKMKRAGNSYHEAVQKWKYSIALYKEFKRSSANVHLCRYEDLLSSPETELRKICDFLEKEYSELMLNGPSNPKMPDMYSGVKLRPLSPLSEEQLEWTVDMREELKFLGYLNGNNS